jgi:hypothetical protein
MTETQLGKVESANETLDRADRIVRPDIILIPGRKQTGLVPAVAGLECAIRHKQNRTSTSENAEFLPSLDGQITSVYQKSLSSPARKNILLFRNRKSPHIYRHPVPFGGALRKVTNAGRGCGGRGRRS